MKIGYYWALAFYAVAMVCALFVRPGTGFGLSVVNFITGAALDIFTYLTPDRRW